MGDFDRNGTVNLADFADWRDCMTGPGGNPENTLPCCRIFDFESDGDVDLTDYGAFVRIFNP